MKQIQFTLILLFFSVIGSATDNPELFSYSKILDAQKKCDSKLLSELPLAENRKGIYSLAERSLAIVSNVSLKEVSRKAKPARGETRDFELKYTIYAQIGCGKAERLIAVNKGLARTELPVVAHAWKDQTHLAIVNDNSSEENFLPSLIVHFTANDLPSESGLNGLACLVDKNDFLSSKAQNLAAQICGKDASTVDIKNTEVSITKVQKMLAH